MLYFQNYGCQLFPSISLLKRIQLYRNNYKKVINVENQTITIHIKQLGSLYILILYIIKHIYKPINSQIALCFIDYLIIPKILQFMSEVVGTELQILILKINYPILNLSPQDQHNNSNTIQQQLPICIDSDTIIDFQQIFNRVNSIIQTKIQTDKFLQIHLLTSDGFKNIYELMENQSECSLQLSKIDDNFVLQIDLREYVKDQIEGLLGKWQAKLDQLYEKVDSVNLDIKKKNQNLEQESKNLIDLAFFYAQPLVQRASTGGIKAANKEVSFQQEQNKFVKTLKNTKIVRDAYIKINVATSKNIQEAIINGVKILHFSCHGTESKKLVIENSDQFGFRYDLQMKQLIKLLQRNPPNIIVFNVCFSNEMAALIHQRFDNTTTIGYKGKANDRYCQIFAEVFYPKIFSGVTVEQAFQCTKKSMGDTSENFYIFSKTNTKIQTSGIGLNKQKCVQIMNQHKAMQQVLYGVKKQIYDFIKKYLLGFSSTTIFFIGQPRHGKTLFIRKCLLYLKQRRKKYNKYQIINLRTSKGQINSMIWLLEEFQDKIAELFHEDKNLILVFDHCQSILNNQQKQFIHYLKQIHKLSMTCIIIVITNSQIKTVELRHQKTKKNRFVFSQLDFREYITYNVKVPGLQNGHISQAYKHKQSKNSYPPQYHELILQKINASKTIESVKNYWLNLAETHRNKIQQSKTLQQQKVNQIKSELDNNIQQLQSRCQEAIQTEIQQFKQQFLFLFPIVSFIDTQPKQLDQMPFILGRKKKSQIADDIDVEIQTFLRQLSLSTQQLISLDLNQQNLRGIYRLLHVIISFKLLPFFTNRGTNQSKMKFIQVYRKILGICLIFKNNFDYNRFMILQMKLLVLLHCLTLNKQCEFYNQNRNKLYHKIIKKKQKQMIQNQLHHFVFPVYHMLEIYGLILKIRENQIISDQNTNLDIYRFDQIQRYYQLYEEMRVFYQNYYGNLCDTEYEGLYGRNQLQLILLPMIILIKNYLQVHGQRIDARIVKQLLQICKKLHFLEQDTINNKSYERIFKKYTEYHISNLFILKKLQFSKINEPKKISRTYVINKLDLWIEISKKNHFTHLQSSIQQYKNQEFSSCVALTSFPVAFKSEKEKSKNKKQCRVVFNKNLRKQALVLINPYRFQNGIYEIMIQSFRKLEKVYYPRMDTLNQQSLKKYREGKIPILISLLMVDCSHQQRKTCQLYLQNNQGLSYNKDITKLDFFKSCINIICGANVLKIKRYIEKQENNLTKIPFFTQFSEDQGQNKIIDQDAVFIFLDITLDKQRGIGYFKKDPILSIYEHIRNRQIFQRILYSFYEEFCKVMFKKNHDNFIQQVSLAFETAKARAKIDAMLQYGHLYSQIIHQMHQQICIYIKRKDLSVLPPPPLKIGQMNKSIYEDQRCSKEVQYGFNEEIYESLCKICAYQNNRENFNCLVVEYDFQNQENLFINSLKIKLRKKGRAIIQKLKNDKEHQHISEPTAASNLPRSFSNQNRSRLKNSTAKKFRQQGFYLYRKFSKQKIDEIWKRIEERAIYESDLSNANQQFQFHIFTCQAKQTQQIQQIPSNQKIRISKFCRFNLVTYCFYQKINKILKDKKKTQNDLKNQCEKFLFGEGKDIDNKNDKKKKQKVLEHFLR